MGGGLLLTVRLSKTSVDWLDLGRSADIDIVFNSAQKALREDWFTVALTTGTLKCTLRTLNRKSATTNH
jgi:hypothetical protein